MQFNVSQLLKEHSGASRRYDILSEFDPHDEGIKPLGLLVGAAQFIRTGEGIFVTGRLQIELEVVCVRCLEPFPLTVEIEIEETFYPTVDVNTGVRLSLEEVEDEAVLINEHHILDLTEVVRQQILLALPMNPLCKPECLGLCPYCGQNINEGPCACRDEMIDPRWAALAKLKGQS